MRLERRRYQWQQLLDRLSDGRWHTSAELYGELRFVVHSRVSDLRRRGYTIESERVGNGAENHRYRLVRHAEIPLAGTDVVRLLERAGFATAEEPEQLALDEAAA